jgi:hypothetical protein
LSLRFELLQQRGELLRRVAGFDGGDGFVGESVTAFVVLVTGVALDPVPVDLVVGGDGVEFAREVGVFDASGSAVKRLTSSPVKTQAASSTKPRNSA